MVIAFFGHSSLYNNKDLFDNVKKTILANVKENEKNLFYCGGYGDFDNLCAKICRLIKKDCPNSEIIFITPYINEAQQKNLKYLLENKLYDSILYPPLEKVPLKFAISKRNEWIVNQADLIIAYVNCTYGGAYKALVYAEKKKKRIINLAKGEDNL